MPISRQLLLLVCVSVLLGLGARVVQKQTVPFWGFPKPLELLAPPTIEGESAPVSPDSAFAPADKPYAIKLSAVTALYMKQKKNNVHFVDARDAKLYAEGHIPGAVNIPFEKVEQYQAKLEAIPKLDLVVCYCDGGDCHLSHDLSQQMTENGWKRVAVYEGGWAEWSKETDFVATGNAPEEAK